MEPSAEHFEAQLDIKRCIRQMGFPLVGTVLGLLLMTSRVRDPADAAGNVLIGGGVVLVFGGLLVSQIIRLFRARPALELSPSGIVDRSGGRPWRTTWADIEAVEVRMFPGRFFIIVRPKDQAAFRSYFLPIARPFYPASQRLQRTIIDLDVPHHELYQIIQWFWSTYGSGPRKD